MTVPRLVCAATIVAAVPSVAYAHPGHVVTPLELWRAWPFEPFILLGLMLSAWLYARGVRRLWRRAGRGRGVPAWRAASFGAGIGATALALLTPLAELGGTLFSAHMLQHVLLMLVAAPLLMLGAPARAMPWALSPAGRGVVRRVVHVRWLRRGWRALTHPAAAWSIHALAIWIWHVPMFFDATLYSEGAHIGQHVSFFGSAMLFWWAIGERGHSVRLPAGAGIIYVFTTAVHGAALGALITFADAPMYPGYAGSTAAWGLSQLEDQQLAGLIMWVPAGFVYVAAGLALLAVWMRASDRSTRAYERARRASSSGARPMAAADRGASFLLVAALLAACSREPVRRAELLAGADSDRAEAAVRAYGCGTCHTISGITGARGRVGPPLDGVSERRVIAG